MNDRAEMFIRKYPTVFNESVGKLKDYKVHLHIDHTVAPKQLPCRRIPFHLVKAVDKEIDKLLANDVWEPIDKPPTWVSPLVVAPKPKKPGEVRITVDSREANKAIGRIRYTMPTTEEIAYDFNGAVMFTLIDLNKAFHQLELGQDSRDITTVITHRGYFRFKRLHMRVSSAPELFQYVVQNQVLTNLQGVRNLADDILI